MSTQVAINPKLDFAIERFIDAPARLVWEALTKPEHLKEWYMPKPWGRVTRAEMDVRPGGIFRIDIATADGGESPNLGCFLEVVPLERLSVGPATVSELAAPFDMQLPSFVQHLSVLEESRLVTSKKRGRVRTYELAPERFTVVDDWLAARRRLWEARLDRFDRYVKQLKEKESES